MSDSPLEERITHGYADNNGIKIHYVSLGTGPLIVMVHGFPDFWYTWRHQMDVLSKHYHVVAIDLRGYNLSDQPQGAENYAMPFLVQDIAAVIQHLAYAHAIVAGHDWGGAIAWQVAMQLPQLVERLIILNLPHPRGLARELAYNPQQQHHSQYARAFQQEGAHLQLPELMERFLLNLPHPRGSAHELAHTTQPQHHGPYVRAGEQDQAYQQRTAEHLSRLVATETERPRYMEAFNRSDFEAMLHYYRQNYPRPPYTEDTSSGVKVHAPVLLIHGLEDPVLLAGGLNNTWEWLEQDLTLVTIPGAGHFVQHDTPDLVTRVMLSWLHR